MARDWTAEQKLAIGTRNKSLLVSAAAGSGKTATLTQRIIESILDETAPIDINRMLIVTFTRAAVGELRERISAAIKECLLSRPGDTRLEKQLMLLPSAKILTIDAFCNDCLKSFPDEAGISPGYRIADEAEMLLISREIFDGVTESILRGELADTVSAEDFEMISDCLADSKKMADIFEVFRKIYEKLRTTCGGIETLRAMVEEYSPESFTTPDNTVFGKYITEYEKEEFKFRAELFLQFAARLSSDPETVGNYADVALSDAEAFTRVAKSASYTKMREAISCLQFKSFSSPKGTEKSDLMLAFANARDKEKKKISDEKEEFFTYEAADWKASFEKLYPLMKAFLEVLRIFDAALSDKKKQLCTFDYTDIERLAFGALLKDGKPTELAKSIAEQYQYIYIDEYQDVNDLQDAIFRAISKENNRFTVGDIKQSIYAYRSANPQIFAGAKRSYPRIENAGESPAASLFMSKNFRSSGGIIDFVNSVFDKMFSIFADGIDYTPADRLDAGRPPLGPSYSDEPIICISTATEKKLVEGYDADDDEEGVEAISAEIVAAKIQEILNTGTREDGSRVRPKDIAIILRSLKEKSEKYTAALTALGIPVKTSGKKNFFMNSDVLLALCLLNSINNPLRDVYLTGLLRSPLFGFSADELVKIRGKEKFKPFYHNLCEYTRLHPEFKKGKLFIDTLERWREMAEGVRTDKLLSGLFRETGLLALAAEHGEKENLVRLYEYARSFEGAAFSGLGSFISYINNVIAEGGKFDCNVSSAEDDAVTVISAHSSKGLEYPIVFFSDTGRKIKNRDTQERFLMSIGFGASMRHRTPLGLALVDNPMMNAVAKKMNEENFEEELRILYVALTRAKEKLCIVGASLLPELDNYKDHISVLSNVLTSRAAARRLTSHLDIITAATGKAAIDVQSFIPNSKISKILATHRAEIQEVYTCDAPTEQITKKLNTGITEMQENDKKEPVGEYTLDSEELFYERFGYEYHSSHLTKLPEKMSVSVLYPAVLDETDELEEQEPIKTALSDSKRERTVPEFIEPNEREESKRRGIATHLFLQFCDLENLEKVGVKEELDRLVANSFISQEDAPRVRLSEVEAFLKSELFTRMRSAKTLWREFRFNTPLPANIFTKNFERAEAYTNKSVLIQGVMDCVIEAEDGSLSVVDYKTDRLTKEELASPRLAEEKMRRAHEDQLYYYCLAAERIFGKSPTRAEVFSLHLGSTVNVMKKL